MNKKIYIKSDDSNSKTNFFLNRLNTIILCAIFCITVLTLLIGCGQQKKKELVLGKLTIYAGDYDRINTPIWYQCLPADIFGDPAKFRRPGFFHYIGDVADLALLRDHHLILIEEGISSSRINAQWSPETNFDWEKAAGKGALVWILDGKTPKGTKRTFKLVLEKGTAPSGPFTVEDIDNKHLLIKLDDKSVLRYNYEVIHKKEGISDPTDRAAYIHPVWTPSGKVITEDFSPEHTYQKGIFNAWVKLKFGDLETDFWNLDKEQGRKLPDNLGPTVIEGPVISQLNIYNKGVYKGNTLMREVCVVRIYAVPEEEGWIFEIHISQMPVNPKKPKRIPTETTTATVIVDGKVKRITKEEKKGDFIMEILQHYYGGMAFRGIEEWRSENVLLDILTSEGKTRADGNGTEARWVDYTGPLGNDWGGLVMFDHPLNQRYPTTVRIHPKLPYFCYSFVKNGPYTVTMSNPINLLYRFLIHNGRPNKKLNERIANDFANPPEVKWEQSPSKK